MDQTPDQFCRLCLNQNPPYFSIFENQAPDMFESLTSIKISVDDPAPDILCLQCLAELKNAYTVQQKFIQTQKYWLERVRAAMKPASTVYVKQENEESEVKECDTTKEYLPSEEVKCEADIREMADLDEAMFDSCKGDSSLFDSKKFKTYERVYHDFVKYCKDKRCVEYDEETMLTYFLDKSVGKKASSLWAWYSMLKSTLRRYHSVDVSKFDRLAEFLKQKSKGYKPKKSQILTKKHIDIFLQHAPDEKYLMIKVALIFGIAGGCARDELCQLQVDDIKDLNSTIIITIRESKTKTQRVFTVSGTRERSPRFLEIYRKYVSLRPATTDHNRFFVAYRQGKCTRQPVGVNVFGKLPSKIASFLKLPNPQDYTGHCFRRSNACLLKAASCLNLEDIFFNSLA